MGPTGQVPFLVRARTYDDRGATSVEYAILGSAVAAVVVFVVFAVGGATLGLFHDLLDIWP